MTKSAIAVPGKADLDVRTVNIDGSYDPIFVGRKTVNWLPGKIYPQKRKVIPKHYVHHSVDSPYDRTLRNSRH